jgi:hypothetical protein
MRQRACLAAIMLGLLAVVAAGEVPIAVSPGASDRSTPIESRCPTFSWGALSGARAYELIVFEVAEQSAAAVRVETLAESAPLSLWTEIPAAALSWTPASDDCLTRGRRYAWFVRALGGVEDGWSEARLFEVRQAPSPAEVEEALDTLRRYLGEAPERRQDCDVAALAAAVAATGPGPTRQPPAAETQAPEIAGVPEIGILAITDSAVDQSSAIRGEATAATGVADGVRGVSASVNGTGVRGTASALSGVTAGVWGAASSPAGFGAFFFNLGLGDPGGTGVYASGALNTSPDLVLGGNFFWPETDRDDGRIRSDPLYPSSDLVLQSNDAVQIELDSDADGEDSDFTVVDKDGQTLFNVDASGLTFVEGDLFVNGEPQGGLVSLAEVQQLVDAGIQDHLATEHPRIVFVTSQTYDGDLGGLSGADDKCQTLALNAGLLGTFKAWISGSSTSEEARDRMSRADVAYRRVDFVKVADGWPDLTDGTLDAPINVNESGNTVLSSLTAYTNTDADGSIHETGRECGQDPGDQWNTNDMFQSGGFGAVGATNNTWSWVSNNDCMNQRRLYCVQQ